LSNLAMDYAKVVETSQILDLKADT